MRKNYGGIRRKRLKVEPLGITMKYLFVLEAIFFLKKNTVLSILAKDKILNIFELLSL